MRYLTSINMIAVILATSFAVASAAPPNPAKSDDEKKDENAWSALQGAWKCDTMAYPGIPNLYPGDTLNFNSEPYLYLVIKEKKAYMIDLYDNGKHYISKKSIRIDATKGPKHWDFSGNAGDGKKVSEDGKPKDPDHPGEEEWVRGIYKIDNDNLVIAESEVRPTEFAPMFLKPIREGSTGNQVSVWTYKKSNDKLPEIK